MDSNKIIGSSYKLVFLVGTLLVAGAFSVFAQSWTPATAVPPGGNTPAPINVGNSSQIKNGPLSINSLLTVGNGYSGTYGLLVLNGVVGIGTASPDTTAKLDVQGGRIKASGGIQIPSGAALGKVLTSDDSGNATWQTPTGGSGSVSSSGSIGGGCFSNYPYSSTNMTLTGWGNATGSGDPRVPTCSCASGYTSRKISGGGSVSSADGNYAGTAFLCIKD